MHAGLTNTEKIRKLPWALSGDFCQVVHLYLTFAPSILILFLDQLGFDKGRIGILLSMIVLMDVGSLFLMPLAARWGFKRTFLIFWTARKFVIAGMMLTPLMLENFDRSATFACVLGITLLFGFCRTFAVSALSPWSVEFIPPLIRGKYAAVQNVVIVLAATATTGAAGWWLGEDAEADRFLVLFAVAFVFGLFSVAFYTRVPGGGPDPAVAEGTAGMRAIRAASGDRQLWRFLAGGACVTLGWGLMAAFLPLFMKEEAGLKDSQILYLDTTHLSVTLVSAFLWGWASDRFGSKPVMLLNLSLLSVYPIGLLMLPLNSTATFPVALTLVGLLGLVIPGWSIGYGRYLYVNLVPVGNRTGYIAIHTAFVGLVSSIPPLIGGPLLDALGNLSGSWGLINITPWTPMFLICIVALFSGATVMSGLASVGAMPVRSFAAQFFQGNPLVAAQAMIAYGRGGQEAKRVATMERLGVARSPLSVDELIEGLNDPSFNVRYEAIISIARTIPHPRLTAALIGVLQGEDNELAPVAAWALGRIGDPEAVPALRGVLESSTPILRARSARALAMMRDYASAPRLLGHFLRETDPALRLPYAAALGTLSRDEAMPALLAFLRELAGPSHRLECALAIATILGQDERAVRLWRRMQKDPGDALAGVMFGLRRRLPLLAPHAPSNHATLGNVVERTARAFGNHDMPAGVRELRVLAAAVDAGALTASAALVLRETIDVLDEQDEIRLEYVTLCVHALHVGLITDQRAG